VAICDIRTAYLRKLNEVYFMSQNKKNTALVVVDARVKNNIAYWSHISTEAIPLPKEPSTRP